MNSTIYFLRHGEVHNPKKLIYGRLPRYALSKKGREEIAQSAKYLQDKKITALFASPLLRAKQSAKIIQQELIFPRIHISSLLYEIGTSFQGRPLTFTEVINGDFYFSPHRLETDETIEQIEKRMKRFVLKAIERFKGQNIVAVSHGDPLIILKASIEGLPLTLNTIRPQKYLTHGEVLKVEIEGGKMSVESVFSPLV